MNKLDKKVNVYVIIVRTLIGLIFYGAFAVLLISPKIEYEPTFIKDILVGIAAIIILIVILFNFITPLFTYKLFGYQVNEDEVIIKKGVLFKKTTIIPIKRIQHVEKLQGPIQMLFKHATVQIFTAGSVDNIFGLDYKEANKLLEILNSKLDRHLKSGELDE